VEAEGFPDVGVFIGELFIESLEDFGPVKGEEVEVGGGGIVAVRHVEVLVCLDVFTGCSVGICS
jgi:hypothetical protein